MRWTYAILISIGLTVFLNVGCGRTLRGPAVNNEELGQAENRYEESLIQEIALLSGVEVGELGGFEISALELETEAMDPSVVDYFRSIIPDVPIHSKLFDAADVYRLCSRTGLRIENYDSVPGCYIVKAGFVTIGCDTCGDAVALDITDGNVYLVSHEMDWETELGENPMANRGRVIEEATPLASTIEEFLEAWRDELNEITTAETQRKREAQNHKLTFTSNERFHFDEPWLIESVPVPDGHQASSSVWRTTVWIEREGEKSSVVIHPVSAKNPQQFKELDPSGPYIDMQIEGAAWRFKRGAWPSFDAFLFHDGEAASVHGGLAWSDEDIRQFLSRLQLRDGAPSDGT